MKKLDLEGKTAAVCGATAGLGREIAMQLADRGLKRLIVIGRDSTKLETLVKALASNHPLEVIPLQLDLTDATKVREAAQALGKRCSRIHLLVQAVGQSDRGTLQDLEPQHLQTLINTNVGTSLNVLTHFRGLLGSNSADAEVASIALIGSLASLFAPRFLGGYAIAKHALAAVAQQARLELSEAGIHVLLACPGPIARADAGTRYNNSQAGADLPAEAMQPGGGAKIKGLDAEKLAADIIDAACRRKRRIIRPRSAALLLWLSSISPTLAEIILRRKTS